MTMLLHCCSKSGQLCPTCQSYAGLTPEEGACVTCLPSRPTGHSDPGRRISVCCTFGTVLINTGPREGMVKLNSQAQEGSKGRVDGPLARRLWPPDGGGLCRRERRPYGRRVLKFDSGLRPLRVVDSRIWRLPPIPLRGTSPRPGGRINCSTLTCIFI